MHDLTDYFMMKILFVTCYGMSILDYIVFSNTFKIVHDTDYKNL